MDDHGAGGHAAGGHAADGTPDRPVALTLLDAQCASAVGELIEQHWRAGGDALLALLQLEEALLHSLYSHPTLCSPQSVLATADADADATNAAANGTANSNDNGTANSNATATAAAETAVMSRAVPSKPSSSCPRLATALEHVGLPIETGTLWRSLMALVADTPDLSSGAVVCSLMAWLESEGCTEQFSRDPTLVAALLRLLPRLQAALTNKNWSVGRGDVGGGCREGRRRVGEETAASVEAGLASEDDDSAVLVEGVQAVWWLLHSCCSRLDGMQILMDSEKPPNTGIFEILMQRVGVLQRGGRWASTKLRLELAPIVLRTLEALHSAADVVSTASPDHCEGAVLNGHNLLSTFLSRQGGAGGDQGHDEAAEEWGSPCGDSSNSHLDGDCEEGTSWDDPTGFDAGGVTWESD